MIDDFMDFLTDNGLFTDEMVNLYGIDKIVKEFLQEFPQYDCVEFKHYIKSYFIHSIKRNIIENKIENLKQDFV